MLKDLPLKNWIILYIYWEISLIKNLGYEINFLNTEKSDNKNNDFIEINNKTFKIPEILSKSDVKMNYNNEIKKALIFNKNLLIENFITPNKLQFPLYRNILEKYFNQWKQSTQKDLC